MATKCYAQVRGSSLRVTSLGPVGQFTDPIRYAVSKAVADVKINEMAEQSSNELIRNEEDRPRLLFAQSGEAIRFTVDVNFLRVDPGVLSLVAGVPLVLNAAGTVVGFDSDTKRPAASFALEVWSKLAGQRCESGEQAWGYTVFPFLKGGYLSGFAFANGLVSFNLVGAQTRRVNRWGAGPYDMEGPHERLVKVVSRNTMYQNFITPAPPPTQQDGIQETTDVIDGGTASATSSDVVDGEFVVTSPWIIEGGRAV